MNMKRILFAACVAVLFLSGVIIVHANSHDINETSSFSELLLSRLQPPTAESMAQRETEWMTTELELTEDQVAKVDPINLKYAEKMAELFQGGPGGDFEAMREKMNEMNAEKRTEFKDILTADQLKKYDEYLAERQQRGPRGQGGPPPNQM